MKLLVVTQYFAPENFRINDLVAGLSARGHEVTVLTGQPNYPSGRFFPGYGWRGPRREQLHGATIVRVPLAPRGRGTALRLVLNYLSFAFFASLAALFRPAQRYDAIFVFEPSPITVCLPAVFASLRSRAPIILWVLDLWPESLAATGAVRSPALLRLVGRGVRWLYARCALVLVQSRAFFSSVQAHGVPAQRIRYFPNWIEPEYGDSASANGLAGDPGRFTIVYAGNIGVAQDFPAILDAAGRAVQQLPLLRFVIAGDGRMAAWTREEVARRGLGANFVFLGQLPASAMPGLFASADALLVALRPDPAFAATIPGKVQSYLSSGRPLLGMLDGEGARVIAESGAGFAAPAGNAPELAEAIIRLAGTDPAQRTQMGQQAREYAEREFGRELLFNRLETWLGQAAGKHISHKE